MERAQRARGVRSRGSNDRGAGASDRSHRQRASHPAVSDRDRQELGLRRFGAESFGERRRRPEAHEPHYRGRRPARLRARRTRRLVLRSLPPHRRARPQGLDRLPRSRLGQSRRQRARSRRRLHVRPVPRSFRQSLRYGSRAGQRRGAAHGHGRTAERAELAGVSLRFRALRRRSVRPRQLRHRDEDGLLAHAAARGVSRWARVGTAAPRSDRARRPRELPRARELDRATELRLPIAAPRRHGTRATRVAREAGGTHRRRARSFRRSTRFRGMAMRAPVLWTRAHGRRELGVREGAHRGRDTRSAFRGARVISLSVVGAGQRRRPAQGRARDSKHGDLFDRRAQRSEPQPARWPSMVRAGYSEVRRGGPRVPARARRGLSRAWHGRQRIPANTGDVAFPRVHHAGRVFDQPHRSDRQSPLTCQLPPSRGSGSRARLGRISVPARHGRHDHEHIFVQ